MPSPPLPSSPVPKSGPPSPLSCYLACSRAPPPSIVAALVLHSLLPCSAPIRRRSQPLAVSSTMASPKKTKASSGYKGARVRPSGRWSAELQHERVCYYLGTFDTVDLAARAYDVARWRLGIPREEINFPDITLPA
ncbi:putative AP2 protein [Hordeum vulgare]|nr:putative AP2 protein [Hordeum vulgare]